ncbi:MAG: hypothetical protein ABI376_07290 [Caulobacteraceae bacterium]
MKLSHIGIGLALAVAGGGAMAATPGPGTADEAIARHIAARGGLAAIRAITTVTMTGTMRPAGFDAQLAWREIVERPDKVRIDATLQGLTVVQAYDGRSGWQIQPFQGRKDAESVSADDAKSLAEEADFEGALVGYKAKGSTVRLLANEDIDGAPAIALRVALKNGDEQTYYLDPDAWLTIRVVTRQMLRGAENLTQTDYGDYEKVDGVWFPFEVASGPKGATVQQRITYDKVVANAPIDPALFERPKSSAATPAPGAPVIAAPAPQAPVPAHPEARATTPPPAR